MAAMHRRLPLLVLAVVVFLFVVFLHVCLSCRPWKQRHKWRASSKRQVGERLMAGMQARADVAAGHSGRRPATAVQARQYDPSMYAHLESWETPLPPSDEELEAEELPTLPLASGSTQRLSQTVRAGGATSNEGSEYTSLLRQGLGDDDDNGGLDLKFGLCSSSAREVSHTSVSYTHLDVYKRQHLESWETPLPPSDEELEAEELPTLPLASGSTQRLSQTVRAGGATSNEGSEYTSLLRQGLGDDDDNGGLDLKFGLCSSSAREVSHTFIIDADPSPRGLQHAGSEHTEQSTLRGDEGFREDVEAVDDDDDIPIRPLGKTGGRGKGRGRGAVRGRSVGRGGRGGVNDDGGKSATYWSPEEQMALVRCKWEQEMHLAGLGHNYGRMRTKEWKWDNIAKRMAIAGRPKDADDCMKKWDNLFQNYKKIQRFENASGHEDFFRLSNEERKGHNFKFRMDRVVYNEIHAGMLGNHTIFPPNVADTGSPDGVQLPRRGAVGGEYVGSEAGGDGCPEERSSARDSDNNAGTGAGGGKRKNVRLQALESIADVMDRHGELMSATIDSSSKRQCSIFTRQRDTLEEEVAVKKAHYVASEETQRMMCHTLMEIAAAIRDRSPIAIRVMTEGLSSVAAGGKSWQKLAVGGEAGGGAGAGALDTVAPVAAAREEAAVIATTREEACGENKSDWDGDDPGSSRVRRGVMTKDLVDRVVLWVDDKAFWTMGEGRRLYNIVHKTREYFVATASGLPAPVVPRSVVLPKSSTKSSNRPMGYNVAFQYSLESVATDIARAMWCGEEWCNVVSATVCAHTIDLSMDLPLWFADTNIEDRPEDDDMAAYQESTIICVSHAFRAAVQMGAHIDDDFISYDRLYRVTDCFRLLLAACMRIMRMAGNDPRNHYEAFYFADLVAKPTLVMSMHRSFDHRRSIVRAAKVVTHRLGKTKATFGAYPNYIPGWAPCGIGFRHDASITGPEDAKKLDWLGLGPPDDDNNNDDGKYDA
ncbi:hypothetical protein CBR_g37430 [Chara braunii]|uniref:Myb-like domain-containing protein n=1 Tax=Chara braunii TaxID=69332 RepID=A0A388LMQ9_CHABU|nr:hypothetical protein CBR_g37430 [Chara braunii]|eukprot:GBG83626.1 hypothetical protein CBR_g37430 [Chara braunii]